MSEAKPRLTTSQTMMATSLPRNTGTRGTGFQGESQNPEPFTLPSFRANFCDLGSASGSQNSFEGQLSRSGLAIWALPKAAGWPDLAKAEFRPRRVWPKELGRLS